MNSEPLIIFSDGLPSADCPYKDAITIIKNNKLKTIIEMKERIVDFLIITNCPWVVPDCPSEPVAILVLLENNLTAIDLKTDGYPQFQHHHQCFTLNESPVTSTQYLVEPYRVFFKYLLASNEKTQQQQLEHQQKTAQPAQAANSVLVGATTTASTPFFSCLPYPVSGGLKCPKSNVFPYSELLITGYIDITIYLILQRLKNLIKRIFFSKVKFDYIARVFDQYPTFGVFCPYFHTLFFLNIKIRTKFNSFRHF